MTSGRPSIELNADLERRIEQLAAERCRHAAEPCDACTNLAVWAVQTLVASGLYAQLRRYQSRPKPTPPRLFDAVVTPWGWSMVAASPQHTSRPQEQPE